MNSLGLETSSRDGHNLRLSGEKLASTLWDFYFLNDCFPRGIRGTDIDFAVEMSGNFLVIEFESPTKKASKGQDMALARLASKEGFTVIRVLGYPPNSVGEWRVIDGPSGTGVDSLKSYIRSWAEGK